MPKVLLVSSPRPYWPFMHEDDNFLVPQSLACLAASLRLDGVDVKILDCMPIKIGWQSLRDAIKKEQPDLIGVGENHALYASESMRVLEIAREVSPKSVRVAGGAHFSNLVRESLTSHPIDFIVRGEGEETLRHLVSELSQGSQRFDRVPGISFLQDGTVVETEARPLIKDLDSLPMPAYDLLPMDLYGRSRYLFSPGGTTIHHSRGCTSSCKFCAWWIQMADTYEEEGRKRYRPRWRTKSVDHTIHEVRELYHKYGKRCLIFVDESWNIDQRWNDAFAEALIREDLDLSWFAFLRIDAILRDEEAGVFEKLVRSGLAHTCIGVERVVDSELDAFDKPFYSVAGSRRCFELLADKYPSVFRQAAFIVGVRDETEASMEEQMRFAIEIRADFPSFHPLTPVPGTPLWDEAVEAGWLEVTDFSKFDWMTPVMPSKFLSRDEIAWQIFRMNKRFFRRPKWFLAGVMSRTTYKRRMYIWWLIVTVRVIWDSVRRRVNPFRSRQYAILKIPSWYEN